MTRELHKELPHLFLIDALTRKKILTHSPYRSALNRRAHLENTPRRVRDKALILRGTDQID
jgi:hypothetical protein